METDLIKSKNLRGGVRSSNIELFRILSMITIGYHSGVRPHKEKINISKEIINKTRGAVAPYAALIITHLSVVSSRHRSKIGCV